jgi:hypothetical protein
MSDAKEVAVMEATDPIDRAEKAVAALKAENDRLDAQLKELKALEARKILGGGSAAGQVPTPPKPETNSEYVKRVLGGRE